MSRAQRNFVVAPLVVALGALFAVACGGSSSASSDALGPNAPPIARVWRARCGACHTRVEPGTRTYDELETALARHRKRVHLREGEWRQMVAFLARTDARPEGMPCMPAPVATENERPPLAAPSPTPAPTTPPALFPAISNVADVDAGSGLRSDAAP